MQAWNVASNLIEDLFYTLKSSENMVADGEFYPNDYMDENWVADVCKEIHSKKADAKLFYSEENLLTDAEKTEAAINYIKQWKEAGAKIEGIDVKLDVPYNGSSLAETKEKIDKLLAKLSTAGLQVRLSDMNVYLADASGTVADQSKATFEDYKGMAELYAYILRRLMTGLPCEELSRHPSRCGLSTLIPGIILTHSASSIWCQRTSSHTWCSTFRSLPPRLPVLMARRYATPG